MKRALIVVALLLAASPAYAGLGPFLQLFGSAVAILATGGTAAYYIGIGLAIGGGVYGGVEARRAQRKATALQRSQYNASLQDRMVTVLTADPPWHIAYGRCTKGGVIVDIFTSDKTVTRVGGSTYVKADGLKHLVVVFATHRIQAINEIYIDGVAVGTLDGNGSPTAGDFYQARTETRHAIFTTSSGALADTPLAVLNAYSTTGSGQDASYTPQTVTIAGNTLNGPGGVQVDVDYSVSVPLPSVRISKHLGSDTEPVDTYFASVDPARYTAAHGMRGLAGICITLDLEDARFQGGPPNITADLTGALVYDWRKDSTVAGGSGTHRVGDPSTWEWSDTNALCVRDFLTQVYGFNADNDEVDTAAGIFAATAGDETISLTTGAVTTTGKRFTCNGSFTTDQDAEAVLEDLAESMGGTVVYGFGWSIHAGVWTDPVDTLTDADLRGPLEVVQAGTPSDQLFNGLRGQYVPAGNGQGPTDINPPYQNAALVAADGDELWNDVTLPFTDNAARARNLARVRVESCHGGQVLRFPAKLRIWPAKVRQRFNLVSTEYGITGTYRATDWQFEHGNGGGPTLLLQQDDASIWDLADAASALPSPVTGLPNPWAAPAISGLAVASSTATLDRTKDGTLVPRVHVTWTAITDGYVIDGGRVEISYLRPQQSDFQSVPPVRGSDTEAWITGVVEGEPITVQVLAVNKYGKRGSPALAAVTVVGASAALYVNTPGSAFTVTKASHVPDGFAFNDQVVAITFTPPVSGTAQVYFDGRGTYTNGGALPAQGTWSLQDAGGAYDAWKKLQTPLVPVGTSQVLSLSTTRTFPVTGGVPYTLAVYANKLQSADTFSIDNMELRVKVS